MGLDVHICPGCGRTATPEDWSEEEGVPWHWCQRCEWDSCGPLQTVAEIAAREDWPGGRGPNLAAWTRAVLELASAERGGSVGAYSEAHRLLNRLEELGAELTRPAQLVLQRLAWEAGDPSVFFRGTEPRQDERACMCGGRVLACVRVDLGQLGWADRYLFECGAVVVWREQGPAREQLAPCGEVDRWVLAGEEADQGIDPWLDEELTPEEQQMLEERGEAIPLPLELPKETR